VSDIACWCGDWHGGLWDEREGEATRMRQIDIDSLDEATLIELNARIVERLQFLHHQRNAAVLQDIRVGSGVMFEGPAVSWSVASSFAATRRRWRCLPIMTANGMSPRRC
jgi:hypothetical protein